MPKYRDWLKAEQMNINPAGTPVIARPSETVGAGYAALTMRNEQIRNTPETARGGYSNLDPNATVQSVSVPQLASGTPDWSKRTPTEQARVNAAQARAQAGETTQGYSALAPATASETVPTTGTEQKQPATEPMTVAGSPSTGETEPTGYAKYLAQHPELAEADRRAEAEYARSLPTYGALAERMAQAGIHGGYGDYLKGVAYAQMQNAKQQTEEAARKGYADYLNGGTTGAKSKLYNLLRNGTYTDEDGNTVQGYNLLNLTDEQYNAVKPTYAKDLEGMGYSPEQIDQAFSDIEATRAQNRDAERKRVTDAFTKYNSGETTATEYLKELGVTDEQIAAAAQNYAEQYKAENGKEISAEEARDAVIGAAIIDKVDNARKEGLLGEGDAGLKVESEFLRTRLPMYGDEYDKTGWKDRGYMLAESIESAIDYKDSNMMTDADVQTVIDNALDAMFGNKPKEVQYVNTGNSVKITLDNGEVLKADYDGKASESASAWLNKNCANCPIAVYDGELYYKAYEKGNWMKLRTKGGITPGFNRGTPEQGDQYFKVIAYAMMRKNNYKAFKDEDTTYTI